ncbi:membrane protein [Microbacterium phage FlameThrower]|nr:membrane protein [Microbacterium phage FlameThrower]
MSLTPRSDYQDSLQATQVQHPVKAVLRTIVQVGIPTFIALGIVVPQIVDIILEQFGQSLPEQVTVVLLTTAGVVTGIAAVITRIMAIPLVNEFLTKMGLGATPKA